MIGEAPMDEAKPPVTTNDSGVPGPSDEYSLTVGPSGPTVLHDHYVVQKMQHFNRERVPERVVHAKGSGAHGFALKFCTDEGNTENGFYPRGQPGLPLGRTPSV